MIGSYNGVTEYSYMCREDDFNDFIDAVGIVNKQESVLGVTQCNKAYATLRFRNDTGDFRATSSASKGGNVLGIGCLKNVPMHEALESDGWTYRPDTNEWYIAVRGNPDTIPPPEGWKAHSATLH